MVKLKSLPLREVTIDDRFWSPYVDMIRNKVLPYQWETLNDRVPGAAKSHSVNNLMVAAGLKEGQYYGFIFQDSDLYKWLESVAYSLETKPDPELETLADGVIEIIGKAQGSDGYINSYYTVKEPKRRFTNVQQGHELYCAGHMIEAAVAYLNATGKRTFLEIAVRFADCIDRTFGPEEGKLQGYPGHQELELALVKLYHATGEIRYLKLSVYFINQRGRLPHFFVEEREKAKFADVFRGITVDLKYTQSHMPPVEQRQAVGHAVRAVYMYSAMADLAAELSDKELEAACEALYDDITEKQMYITGAIGPSSIGEAFTAGYDLPDALVYGETCASIGLSMFCRRMNALYGSGKYYDTLERALYNTVLSCISLTGTEFFYVNPLSVDPAQIEANPNYRHVDPVRKPWFDCSCCPTNLVRLIMSLGHYIYAVTEDCLYVNLYISGAANHNGRRVTLSTEYPYGGTATVTAQGGAYKLKLRNPAAAPIIKAEVNGVRQDVTFEDGYLVLERQWNGEEIKLWFDVTPRLAYTSLKVQDNAGKAAVVRGPLVYCAEGADNGTGLGTLVLDQNPVFTEVKAPAGLPETAVALEVSAWRYTGGQAGLYGYNPPDIERCKAVFIPYHLWANRGVNEMRVNIPTVPCLPGVSGK